MSAGCSVASGPRRSRSRSPRRRREPRARIPSWRRRRARRPPPLRTTDKLPTNYASHPFAGTLYYTVARSNHLSFAESFLYAVVGSTTWEYFGEIREITSVNDLHVTPVSGAAIGEATMQLSGFFQHGDKTFANGALSFLASPVNAVNSWTEDTEPLRAARTDALGFSTDTWHRFVARAGVGATVQEAGDRAHPRATYLDERFGLDLALAHLPGYRGAAKEARLYDDGNVSDVTIALAQSQGHLVDALFATRVVPVGSFHAIEGIDDQEGPLVDDTLRLADRRALARGTLAWVPRRSGLRVAAEVERRVREGEVGDAHASRSETSAVASLGVLF